MAALELAIGDDAASISTVSKTAGEVLDTAVIALSANSDMYS
jgi:hypothetical protein